MSGFLHVINRLFKEPSIEGAWGGATIGGLSLKNLNFTRLFDFTIIIVNKYNVLSRKSFVLMVCRHYFETLLLQNDISSNFKVMTPAMVS
jgi:hypothetical protein